MDNSADYASMSRPIQGFIRHLDAVHCFSELHLACPSQSWSLPFLPMTQFFDRLRKEGGARFGDRAAAPKRREVAEEKGPGVGLAFGCHGDRTRCLVPGSGPGGG